MSREDIRKFTESVVSDSELQWDIQQVLNEFAEAVVSTAKRQGCDFTVEEAGAWFADQLAADAVSAQPPAGGFEAVLVEMLRQIKRPRTESFGTVDSDILGQELQ